MRTFYNSLKEIEIAQTQSFYLFIIITIIGSFILAFGNSIRLMIFGATVYTVGLIAFALDQRYWDLKRYILHGTKGCKK